MFCLQTLLQSRDFKHRTINGELAQLGERLVCNQEVIGSIPIFSRSIFSSRYMQNRHQAEADANLYFLQKTKPSTVSLDTNRFGGAERDRTADPLLAKQVLSQLSYSPISSIAQDNPGSATFRVCRPFPTPIYQKQMVGPGRLELPTPRLSSVCSNQLSYGPILVKPVQPKLDRRGSLSS